MEVGIFLCSLLALPACKSAEAPSVGAIEFSYDLLEQLSKEHPLWWDACRRPSLRRIGIPSDIAKPSRSVPREYVDDVRRAVAALPPPIRHIYNQHVCAIVPVTNLLSSGTVVILAQDTTYGVILLDVEATDRPVNAWMTYKESTPFVLSNDVKIVGTMADEVLNTRQTTLEFVITHELGHIYDMVFPRDEIVRKTKTLSWPRSDRFDLFPFRHYPAIFDEVPLPAERSEEIYEMIANSSFPSPAAMTSQDEDFADSLATYVHSVVLKRPWQLEVHRKGKVTYRLESCWGTERCRPKETYLEYLVGELERKSTGW